MKKILVLVSGGGTNFQALLDNIKKGSINGQVVGVISSNKNAYALTRAKENNIQTFVVSKKKYKSVEEYQEALYETIESIKPDLIVLAGYLSILSEKITKKYDFKIINVHPALIPSFCGMSYYGLKVHEKALEYGVKVTGATVHFVNEKADEGKIILQKAIDVLEDDTPEILQIRVMEECEWVLLPYAVKLFCDDKISIIDNNIVIKK